MKNKTKYVIVRTQNAGVFAGIIDSRNGREVVLLDARRLWYWKGAASLSQLAVEGVSQPNEDVTKEAEKIIRAVPVWKA